MIGSGPLYFDHNATTPLLPEVLEAMTASLREDWGNPSSSHAYGRRAHEAIERARAEVAGLLGANPADIVFTSGGTESNNLAIRGVLEGSSRGHLVTCAVEHPATRAPCQSLAASGAALSVVGVDATGRVDPAAVASVVRDDTALVTVMHANNEVGTVNPIADIAAIARRVGAWTHTDAAQSVGKLPVDVDALGVDLLSVAGHKLYGPKGVGALYVRPGTPLLPLLLGAGHERGRRPGTENTGSIVGLGVACRLAARDLEDERARLLGLRERLWARLSAGVPGLVLHGHPVHRLPNTLNVGFPGVSGSAVLASAPEVAASTGSACHEGGRETASAVLLAMGLSPGAALGAVRLSLGRASNTAAVDTCAEVLTAAWVRLAR